MVWDVVGGYPLPESSLDMRLLTKQCVAQLSRCAVCSCPPNNTSQISMLLISPALLTSAFALVEGVVALVALSSGVSAASVLLICSVLPSGASVALLFCVCIELAAIARSLDL